MLLKKHRSHRTADRVARKTRAASTKAAGTKTAGTKTAIALSALTFAQLILFLAARQTLPAYAQALTDEDINSYARAIAAIEPARVTAYSEASDILTTADSDLSLLEAPLSCTSNRLSDMPDISRSARVELRTVLVTFCNEASRLAEENDLTPQRFNAITESHREDPEIAARIRSAIGDL